MVKGGTEKDKEATGQEQRTRHPGSLLPRTFVMPHPAEAIIISCLEYFRNCSKGLPSPQSLHCGITGYWDHVNLGVQWESHTKQILLELQER